MASPVYPIHHYVDERFSPVIVNGLQTVSVYGYGVIIADDGVMPMFMGPVPPKSKAQMKFNALVKEALAHGKEAAIQMYQNGTYQESAE